MSDREKYDPGAADVAQVRKDGETWTLVLVKELRHPPEKVWRALTEPEHLREWAPFDASGDLGKIGTVELTWVGSPTPSATRITRADSPKLLEYESGGKAMRWELEERAGGTHLTLWAVIDRPFISMGAAGWHIAFDVLQRLLDGAPIGRIAGAAAMQFDGWQRLNAAYAEQFGVALPNWGTSQQGATT
jgi:uncharacterized protein YndB with AHSA1/START domain